MQIWEAAGGSSLNAAMAAAIALAESRGDPTSTDNDSNGSVDRGLWQINSTNGAGSSYDVMTNARAAVSMSQNGTTWRPWCTAYSDGECGTKGGTYLGAGAPFYKFLSGASMGAATSTSSGGGAAGTTYASYPTVQNTSWYNWIIPFGLGAAGGATTDGGTVSGIPLGGFSNVIESGLSSAIGDVLKPIGRVLLHGMLVVGGVSVMVIGLWFLFKGANLPQIADDGPSVAGDMTDVRSDQEKQADAQLKSSQMSDKERRTSLAERQQTFKETQSQKPKPARAGRTQKAAQAKAKAGKAGEVEDAVAVAP
jgi:hypothetical protein